MVKSKSPREMLSHPLLITAAVVGAAVCARQCYRYLRPQNKRPKWKSKSRRPQISRWESEGGDVPEVQPLGSQLKH
jgi:hypothetical protein